MKLANLIFVVALAARGGAACGIIAGDQIVAGDFAAFKPVFASLDATLPLAMTPMPGVTRVFRGDELVRLARANGLTLSFPTPEICFARYTEPLTADRLLPVLRDALGIDDARIEISDFSRFGVPKGTLEFTRAGLSANGDWRGQVIYSRDRSVSIWVKTQITTEQTWVESAAPLAANKPIDAGQLVIKKGPRFPLALAPVDAIDRVAGRAAVRSIRMGEPIFASMIVAPKEVERGDTVRVEVVSGQATLTFDAAAETSGRMGEMILLKNPDNGRHFQARIEAKGKVLITK